MTAPRLERTGPRPGRGWCRRLLLLVCALVASVAAPAAETMPPLLGGLLTQSRVLYPLQVGRWQAADEQRYTPQAAGVSVRYYDNRKGPWLDVYVYAVGPLDADGLARIAQDEREGIGQAAVAAGRAVELGTLSPVALDARADAWQLDLRYPDDRTASAMVLFAQQLYLVKIRASASGTGMSTDHLLGQVREFAAGLAARLRIAHTGGCWLGERIAYADAPGHDPAALATATSRDGRVQAQLHPDRILVDASLQDDAAALAAALNEAVYPGCVAPEAIDLAVPPQMREIRIEYPPVEPAGRGGPMPRRSRGGVRSRIG